VYAHAADVRQLDPAGSCADGSDSASAEGRSRSEWRAGEGRAPGRSSMGAAAMGGNFECGTLKRFEAILHLDAPKRRPLRNG
jgi:hypothetical protein